MDYDNPRFDTIVDRIKSRRTHVRKKVLSLEEFSKLTAYDVAAVLHAVVKYCKIATYEDIRYLFTAIFRNQFSRPKVHKILSILVGAEYLQRVGAYGHFAVNARKPPLTTTKNGFKEQEMELRILLANVFEERGDPEFLRLLEESQSVN